MIDVYEAEYEKIYDVVQTVSIKFAGQSNSGDNLLRLQNELVDRLADIGFGAVIDVTPCIAGKPITVSITERLDKEPFDAERKRWEVKQRIKENKPNPDHIEGAI